jgi:hypothetical protein
MEGLVALEIGVLLLHDHQARERALEVVLRLLEGSHLGRVAQVIRRQLDARGLRAGLGHLGEGVLLVLGRGLDRRDQVRHQIRAALELRLEIGPLLRRDLVLLDQLIVLLAPRQPQRSERGDEGPEAKNLHDPGDHRAATGGERCGFLHPRQAKAPAAWRKRHRPHRSLSTIPPFCMEKHP